MAASSLEESKLPGGYLVTPRVPQGLAAAVEGLTREVIRHSPDDIYVFAAHHFEKLLFLREQCGPEENTTERESNLQTLREMNQALKMRDFGREHSRVTKNTADQVGWSLNQTAKVLKRHRSIFGDAGRRITTDEVFLMANQKQNRRNSSKSPIDKTGIRGHRSSKQKASREVEDDCWKASSSRTERSWSNDDSVEVNSETRAGPRLITQISSLQSGTGMLAKDIKTELRKNRISSRERRNIRAKPQDRASIDRSDSNGKTGKPVGKNISSRKSSEKKKSVEEEIEQKRSYKNVESSKPKAGRRSDNDNNRSQENTERFGSRAPNMDGVKDYNVQRFATTKSLEELQSVNYVERVQEIIDETGPIIKEKVEELKSGVANRSSRSSWFAKGKSNRVVETNGSESDNRGNGEYGSPEETMGGQMPREIREPISEALKSRLTETQNLLENVSTSLARPLRRSRSARSSRRSKSPATNNEIETSILESSGRVNGLETRLSKTRNLLGDISSALSRPMRRSSSAKNIRKYDENLVDDLDYCGTKTDALKLRLDETQYLMEGVAATFAKPGHAPRSGKSSRSKSNVGGSHGSDEGGYSDSQSASKVSLPAMKTASVRSSPGSVSRSDSDNFILPAISPEVSKSPKVKEDLVLPALSPSGTASTIDDSKIAETTDVLLDELDIPEVPVEDFIPEAPVEDYIPEAPVEDYIPEAPVEDYIPEATVEDYIPEVPVEDFFRDSLNVTPDFDSTPLRPDSLEPEEIIENVEPKISNSADDLEGRLQEIQKVEKDIEECLESKSSDNHEISVTRDNTVIKDKLEELEEAEKRIDRILDAEDSDRSQKENSVSPKNTDVSEVSSGNIIDGGSNENDKSPASKTDEKDEEVENREKDSEQEKVSSVSPEQLNYTYVLTEGSPYEIPDTVTTVIIPERMMESPESDRLNVEMEEGNEAKLSLVSGSHTHKPSIDQVEETNVETVDESLAKTIETDSREDPGNVDEEAPKDDDKIKGVAETSSELLSANDVEESIESRASPKNELNPFGEFVVPESTDMSSSDMDFIREMENRHDIHLSRQDLSRINEEMSEELEERDEENRVTMKIKEIEEKKDEIRSNSRQSINENESKTDDNKIEAGDNDGEGADAATEEMDKSKGRTESDLSPEPSRPELCSESSNEAKESSAADEALESGKGANSFDEEKSSETRTPESSNEVKETTLTDGLSFSLDPTRPFVPELNLDSLQDITVSSFKMTEDDYDNQAREGSENTNSITETLTSDENNRIIDNAEFSEEAVMEYIISSSSRSKISEKYDESTNGREEVIEEPMVKRRIEIKEDIIDKVSTYVTGPSCEEYSTSDETEFHLLERESQMTEDEEKKDAQTDVYVDQGNVAVAPEVQQQVEREIKEVESEISIEHNDAEVATTEQIVKEVSSEQEGREEVDTGRSIAEEKIKIEKVEEVEHKNDFSEIEKPFIEQPEIPEEEINEETKDVGKVMSLETGITENSLTSDETEAQTVDEAKSTADLSAEFRASENESDEIHEDSFVDEDTPLAVSRSASQCTTRRVSSGNLARLREDPALSWTEETAQDVDNSLENSPSSPKVKFSRIGNETIREQGSDEMDQSQDSDSTKNDTEDRTNDSINRDSKEYHIYVPEVDASDDTSKTTESTTFDSAVTKIQARVRGFLTRIRIQRGQQNRSSTLGSIPSIQDSIAADSISTEDQQQELETVRDTDDGKEISSARALEHPGIESSGKAIVNDHRGLIARKRLRREDAVQRTTLSLEKSFAENGIRHTGEFHDCIPLPIHDIVISNKKVIIESERRKSEGSDESTLDNSGTDRDSDSNSKNIKADSVKIGEKIDNDDSMDWIDRETVDSLRNPEKMKETAETCNIGQMFFGQSSNVPVIQFGMPPNVGQIVDLVVLAKDDSELQSGYLNFITSVEDAEADQGHSGISMNMRGYPDGDINSNESLKEPLALSATPIGMVIEELTSSGAEQFLNNVNDTDETIRVSSNSSLIPPENVPESPGSEAVSISVNGQQKEDTIMAEKILEGRAPLDQTNLSSLNEREILGPESSVDSLECPVVRNEDKSTSASPHGSVAPSAMTTETKDRTVGNEVILEQKDSSSHSPTGEEKLEDHEETLGSIVDESTSAFSDSLKIIDSLGLGSENSADLKARESILQITLTPGGLMKSKSQSQDSQVSEGRIESPITMVQMAPQRSESLQQDESGINENKNDETSNKPVDSPHTPTTK